MLKSHAIRALTAAGVVALSLIGTSATALDSPGGGGGGGGTISDPPPSRPTPTDPLKTFRIYLNDLWFTNLEECSVFETHNTDGTVNVHDSCTPTAEMYGSITVNATAPLTGDRTAASILLSQWESKGCPSRTASGVDWKATYADEASRYWNCPKRVETGVNYRIQETTTCVAVPYRPSAGCQTTPAVGRRFVDVPFRPGDAIKVSVDLRDYDSGSGDDNVCRGSITTPPVRQGAVIGYTSVFHGASNGAGRGSQSCTLKFQGITVSS